MGLGFGVWGVGLGFQGLGFWVWGFGPEALNLNISGSLNPRGFSVGFSQRWAAGPRQLDLRHGGAHMASSHREQPWALATERPEM